MKVYLAGGMKSNWQDFIRNYPGLDDVSWLDPRKHGCKALAEYTTADAAGIDSCDVLVVFLEEANPGGYNLAWEMGYASSKGKTIVCGLEKPRKYFTMPIEKSDVVYYGDTALQSLADYLVALKAMIEGEKTPVLNYDIYWNNQEHIPPTVDPNSDPTWPTYIQPPIYSGSGE